jgi:hypothetical protein
MPPARISLPSSKSDSYTTTFIRQHINTRLRLILLSSFLLLLFLNLFAFKSHIPSTDNVLESLHLTSAGPTIQLALVNAHHANDEVHTALYNAFSQIKNVNVTRYQQTSSFGMEDVVARLSHPPKAAWQPISEFTRLSAHGPAPDIVVSTTCGNDYSQEADAVSALKLDYARLLEHHNTHLICVMHQGNHFVDGFGFEVKSVLKPWLLAGRLDIVTLSPHVGEYFMREVYPLFWDDVGDVVPTMRNFVPVFPVQDDVSARNQDVLKLGIQGSFDHGRNFTSLFDQFVDVKAEWDAIGQGEDAERIQLHIIGSGTRPEVPEVVEHQVIFHENLDYTSYYSLLGEMDAMMPAFSDENWGGNDYYSNVASTTVPASLISVTPLIADFKLIEAYAYLRLGMVWFRDDNEHEIDAAFRMLAAGASQRSSLKAGVLSRRNELLQENLKNVKEWVVSAINGNKARLESAGQKPVVRVDEAEASPTSFEKAVHRFNPFPGRDGSKRQRSWQG